MDDSLENHVEDSVISNLIREAEEGNTEAAEGMGSMPCQNSVTDAGGDKIMSTAEQEFLQRVLSILRNAHEYLPNHWYESRHKLEFFDMITEAWEGLTGEEFASEEEEEDEDEDEDKDEDEDEEEEEGKIMKGEI